MSGTRVVIPGFVPMLFSEVGIQPSETCSVILQ